MTEIFGTVEAGFEPVRDLFAQQFEKGEHIGGGVSVYHRGRKTVDVWAGVADRESGRAWERDTMAASFSTTKGLTATALHALADRGLVDYEAPVAKYWPEFAQNGKDAITVYHLLTHQAGMSIVPEGLTADDLADWEKVIHGLEIAAPAWEPGTASGYHAITFGYLVGEVVRRVSGKRIGEALRDYVTTPLGIEDEMFIGTPAEAQPRVATLQSLIERTPEMEAQSQQMMALAPLLMKSMQPSGGGDLNDLLNSSRGRSAEIPAINGTMTARALARMYAALANYGEIDGVRLMSEQTVRTMSERQTKRADKVIVIEVGWSLGYMNGGEEGWPQGPDPTAFGHAGFGGSLGFADPALGMGFGFVTNALTMDLIGYGRTAALAEAARACCLAAG